jgi:Uma2 family endonuclease
MMATPVQTQTLHLVAADGETIGDAEMLQGLWTVEQYLRLTECSNRLFEFTDGSIEVLPIPTKVHQAILGFLYRFLYGYIQERGGAVFLAPMLIELREGKFREPDIILALDVEDPRLQNAYFTGADLVIEIVSPSSRTLDTQVKRTEYAEAGIPEYWIVDPEVATITVLRLERDAYIEHGVFRRGETATSSLLEGFVVEVSAVLDAR